MKKYVILPVVAAVMSLLIGCTTSEKSSREGDTGAVVTTLSSQGITVTAQNLTRKMLYDRFGTRNNPFIDYEQNPLIVIDFTMSSESEMRFRLSKIEFDYLGRKSRPVSGVELNSYWERQLRNPGVVKSGSTGQYRNWSYNKVSNVINKHVLPDAHDLVPGTVHRGLMLFEGVANRYGTTRITIPFYDTGGKMIHKFILVLDV